MHANDRADCVDELFLSQSRLRSHRAAKEKEEFLRKNAALIQQLLPGKQLVLGRKY